jgi:hypothetical protein
VLGPSSGHAEFLKGACAGKQAGNMSSPRRTRKNKFLITTKLRTCAIAMEKKGDGVEQ